MPYNTPSRLWPNDHDSFFRDRDFIPVAQRGPHCVSTVLGIMTGAAPETFQPRINTQDPVSWSEALTPYGMKLAYCPTDVRKLEFYLDELVEFDDLFAVSYFTPEYPSAILRDPDEDGWVCGSHIVVFHRGSVIDPALGRRFAASAFPGLARHTKRIFRVVPAAYRRGL